VRTCSYDSDEKKKEEESDSIAIISTRSMSLVELKKRERGGGSLVRKDRVASPPSQCDHPVSCNRTCQVGEEKRKNISGGMRAMAISMR